MQHAKSKFVMESNSNGTLKLLEGKWPTRHQQLFKGELTQKNGSNRFVEVVFSENVGLTFYHGWS